MPELDRGRYDSDAHTDGAPVDILHPDQCGIDADGVRVGVTPSQREAETGTELDPASASAIAIEPAPGKNISDQTSGDTQARVVVGVEQDALLLVLADVLDDLEHVRIASAGRLRSLIQVKGLEGSKPAVRMAVMVDDLERLEKDAVKDLQRAMRDHPLGPWVKGQVGVGEKQAARLIAAIGWPANRSNPAKLWQYCGHGDPTRSHCRRGQEVSHSPLAKKRVHLIAQQVTKFNGAPDKNGSVRLPRSPYRDVYDAERAKWADRDTTDGHKHNHALRVVGKRILLDLWREARRIDTTRSNA